MVVIPQRSEEKASSRAGALLRGMLFVFGALVAGQALLGFTGLLGGKASLLWALVILAVGLVFIAKKGEFSFRPPLLPGWKSHDCALLAAQAASLGVLLHAAAGRRQFIFDTISFHFYFPAAWMHSGRLEIVPTVFGDVAPAYNPSNVELLFHLAMAPLASDYLTRCVQVPIAGLALLALYVGSRELGASRSAALAAGLAFLFAPIVWWNAMSGLADLALASFLLACLALLTRLWRKPSGSDLAALAVAYGLFIGSKFVALPYSLPIFLAGAAVAWRHRRARPSARRVAWTLAVGLGLVVATGGFWYLRNALVTGNPIFPLAVNVAGLSLLPGLHDGALMRQWVFHRPVGEPLLLLRLVFSGARAFMLVGVSVLLIRRRSPETWLAAVLLAVYWFVVPYQHARFLIAFYGLVAVGLALVPRAGRRAWPGHLLILLSMAGSALQWPRPGLLVVVAAGLLGSSLPWLERRVSAAPVALLALAMLGLSLVPGFSAYESDYPGYSAQGKPHLLEAWRWTRDNLHGKNIAYAGSNLPYPLFGRDLANRVSYVPISLEAGSKVHDYEIRQAITSAEPTLYRDFADTETWLRNLHSLGCNTLFVSSLAPRQREKFRFDAEGFPLERTWADDRPDLFDLLYENRGVRIYAIGQDNLSEGQ